MADARRPARAQTHRAERPPDRSGEESQPPPSSQPNAPLCLHRKTLSTTWRVERCNLRHRSRGRESWIKRKLYAAGRQPRRKARSSRRTRAASRLRAPSPQVFPRFRAHHSRHTLFKPAALSASLRLIPTDGQVGIASSHLSSLPRQRLGKGVVVATKNRPNFTQSNRHLGALVTQDDAEDCYT